MVQSDQDGEPEESDEQRPRWAMAPAARPDTGPSAGAEPLYKIFTTAHDEIVPAEDLCDAEELSACAPIWTSS
ncbi:hypothetical protein ACRAWD_29185 [Caulobacter segnis]